MSNNPKNKDVTNANIFSIKTYFNINNDISLEEALETNMVSKNKIRKKLGLKILKVDKDIYKGILYQKKQ